MISELGCPRDREPNKAPTSDYSTIAGLDPISTADQKEERGDHSEFFGQVVPSVVFKIAEGITISGICCS